MHFWLGCISWTFPSNFLLTHNASIHEHTFAHLFIHTALCFSDRLSLFAPLFVRGNKVTINHNNFFLSSTSLTATAIVGWLNEMQCKWALGAYGETHTHASRCTETSRCLRVYAEKVLIFLITIYFLREKNKEGFSSPPIQEYIFNPLFYNNFLWVLLNLSLIGSVTLAKRSQMRITGFTKDSLFYWEHSKCELLLLHCTF